MKVTWEEHDMRPGRIVHRDMDCMICRAYVLEAPVVLVVIETGRVMYIGTQKEMADYMTENAYFPGRIGKG